MRVTYKIITFSSLNVMGEFYIVSQDRKRIYKFDFLKLFSTQNFQIRHLNAQKITRDSFHWGKFVKKIWVAKITTSTLIQLNYLLPKFLIALLAVAVVCLQFNSLCKHLNKCRTRWECDELIAGSSRWSIFTTLSHRYKLLEMSQ